jgi:hypothetical protein
MSTVLKGLYPTPKTTISLASSAPASVLDACHVKKLVRIYHCESPSEGDTFCAGPSVFGRYVSPQDGLAASPAFFAWLRARETFFSRLRQGPCGEK